MIDGKAYAIIAWLTGPQVVTILEATPEKCGECLYYCKIDGLASRTVINSENIFKTKRLAEKELFQRKLKGKS